MSAEIRAISDDLAQLGTRLRALHDDMRRLIALLARVEGRAAEAIREMRAMRGQA